MIEKYLEYIEVERRYSPHTIESYRKDLRDFYSFVLETEGEEDLRKIGKKVVRNFMVFLSEKKLSKRSINRKLSSLRSFYLFLLKIQEIEVSPLESISSLKFYSEKQIPLSREEVSDLQNIDNHGDSKMEFFSLLVEVLYQTGVRRMELCNLKNEDVDFSKLEIRVHGKGNKLRVLPISKELGQLLESYVKNRGGCAETQPYFFLSQKGEKLGEKFVYLGVKSYLSLVTSKEKKSPHILRHSFATHVLENGAEISRVKNLLGHASLASTQVYTHSDIAQLKKVFEKAHPRAKKK